MLQGNLELYSQSAGLAPSWFPVRAVLRKTTFTLLQRRIDPEVKLAAGSVDLPSDHVREFVCHKPAIETLASKPTSDKSGCRRPLQRHLGIGLRGGNDEEHPLHVSYVDPNGWGSKVFTVGDVILSCAAGRQQKVDDGNLHLLANLTHDQGLSTIFKVLHSASEFISFRVKFSKDLWKNCHLGNFSASYTEGNRYQTLARISVEFCHAEIFNMDGRTIFELSGAPNDSEKVLLLRPKLSSPLTTQDWVDRIMQMRDAIPPRILSKPRPRPGFSGLVAKMGRVQDIRGFLSRGFIMVVTDHELCFYNKAPMTAEELERTVMCYDLAHVTVKLSEEQQQQHQYASRQPHHGPQGLIYIMLSKGQGLRLDTGSYSISKIWKELIQTRATFITLLRSKASSSIGHGANARRKRFIGHIFNGPPVYIEVSWETGIHILQTHDRPMLKGGEMYHINFRAILSLESKEKNVLTLVFVVMLEDENRPVEKEVTIVVDQLSELIRTMSIGARAHLDCIKHLSQVRH